MTTTTIQKIEEKATSMISYPFLHGKASQVHLIKDFKIKQSRFILTTNLHEFDIDLVHALRLLGEFKPLPYDAFVAAQEMAQGGARPGGAPP